jgi:hypothetical protein
MEPVNRIRWFLESSNTAVDLEDGIDFDLLTEIKPAELPSDLFARGFILGYALSAATAIAAILLCVAR